MSWSAGTFTRTNGVYSGTGVWASDEAALVDIESARHDTHDQDLATGINSCIHKGGQNAATADLPMGGFKHTNVANASARSHYGAVGQIQDSSFHWGGTATGSGSAYAITCSPAPSAYAAGQMFRFIANHTNATTTTLNVNSLGAKNIHGLGGRQSLGVWSGSIINGSLVEVIYDGTQFVILNPSETLALTAAAGTTQGTATSLTSKIVYVNSGTGGANDGVRLPSSAAIGYIVDIYNSVAMTLKVYPASGDQIDALGTNINTTIGNAIWKRFHVTATGPVQWYAIGS